MKKIFMASLVAGTALLSACNNGTPKANLKTDTDTLSYAMGMVMSAPEGDFQNMLSQQGSDSAYVDEFIKGYMAGIQSADDKKKLAYNMGLQAGLQFKMQLPMIEQQVFQGDSTKKVSVKNFLAGFTTVAKNKSAIVVDGKPLDKEEANKLVMAYMFNKQKKESAKFLADKAKEAGVKPLAEGILYKEITKGEGEERCTASDSVIVKYEGSLPNGMVFDNSDRKPEGMTISLSNTIKGWQIALPKMPVGATWELYIPYELGYGESGTGPIPPFSALTFKITLVKIVK